MEHIQIFLGYEVGGVTTLGHMEDSETPGGFRFQLGLLTLLPDLLTDFLVHIFG